LNDEVSPSNYVALVVLSISAAYWQLGQRIVALSSCLSSQVTHSKMLTLSATIAPFGMTGLANIFSAVLKKYKNTQLDGYGLTTTRGQIWLSVG